MIRRKIYWKKTLSVLMAMSILCSTTVTAVEAETSNQQEVKSDLTNEQLASLVNPILQSYTADSSMKTWRLTPDTRLVILSNEENIVNERLAEVVKLVNAEFVEKEIVSNNSLAMVYGGENDIVASDVAITIDDVSNITDESESLEAYRIDINENGLKLTGASENAILYGLRTIQNLMLTNDGLVYGTIIDYPDVAERRIHVDCGRKYFSKDWFIRQIREMSYMKMNAIQMHFSENLGFRLECSTDPAIMSDQYLTKAEIKEIIEEARKYGVKVIPSFDTPGHVDQILKVHPEYGQVSNTGEHFASGLDVTNPEAVEYFKSLYREFMETFEGCTDFHIGGDEYMEFDRAPFTTKYRSVLNNYAKERFGSNAVWQDALANYINEIAELVYEGGFKPRVWNDGLYYGEKSYSEKPQTIKMHDYIGVDFWSQMGWNRDIANLNTIISKGHTDIYNVNAGFFYYVLRNSKPTDGREQHSFDYLNQDRRIFDQWTPGKFESNTISDDSEVIKGSSMAIWCDKPDLVNEDVITDDISKELRSLATKSWNTASNSITTLENFRETYGILGNVAGFEKGSQLPEVGEFLPAENLGKVTLKYLSTTGKVLKEDVIKYGTIGNDYSFEAESIYGYALVSDEVASGTFSKEDATYTFTYELYCNKTNLEKEINNSLDEASYIKETYLEYRQALEEATAVYNSEVSEQLDVDQSLSKLLDAKKKVVLLEYYPLYVETEYTLKGDGFISGYDAYLAAVENGKVTLYSDDITIDSMKEAFREIQTTKDNLMKRDGNTPVVESTIGTYTHSGAAWQGPYFPPEKYAVERMVDGDETTKAWFADSQKNGHEIAFSFPKQLNMSQIKIVQPTDAGDDIIKNADIEVATTKGEWTKVGTLTSADTIEKTISFEKIPVQYVRIVLRENANYWYQVAEVYFTYDQIQESTVLKEMIIEAEELDVTGKSKASISNMVDALIEAQKVHVENSTDTTQVESHLRLAIDSLEDDVATEVFKTHLEIAVEEANKITEEDLSKVVPAVVNEFKAALEEAKYLLENVNATQGQINESFNRLSKVMQMLSFEKGDKEALISLVNKINILDEKEYIAETWNKLKVQLDVAINVIEDENALEAEVVKSYDSLIRSFLELRLKPNKDKLHDLINKAENINREKFTATTFNALDKALQNARNVFLNEDATEKEVTNANKDLELALNSLVEKNTNTNKPENDNIVNSGTNSNGSNSNSSDKNPSNDKQLPKTGGTSSVAVGLAATIISTIGAVMLKKRKNY